MESIKLDTDTVEARHKLEYWTDLVCASFVELECVSAAPDHFFGSIENTGAADVQFSNIRAAAQHVSRLDRTIARSDLDYFLLSLQTGGQGIVQQDGRCAILQSGDLALYDTTRSYDLRFHESFGQIVLRLPRSMITRGIVAPDQFTAVRIDGGSGAGLLLSTFLRQVQEQIANINVSSIAKYNAVVVDLVSAALAEQVGAKPQLNDSRHVLRMQISNFIDANLRDANLRCERVADRFNISTRYLRKIFEDSGIGVAEMIWIRRLDQARRDLLDPLKAQLPISEIGYSVGFKDTGHFSRAFKSTFGVTPREVRNGHAETPATSGRL